MLAHALRPSFPVFRPAFRRSAVLLRLPMKPEVLEMNALLGRVASERDRTAFAALVSHKLRAEST